jgi:uncharacterized protein
MRIAVTGGSGLIGRTLIPHLRGLGHEVLVLVRRPATAPDEVRWDPERGFVDLLPLAGTQAIVHLAGAGVGDRRWTPAYKAMIRDSRVLGTDTIARAATELSPRPEVLISASAIGFYGQTGPDPVDETGPRGEGFLANVTVAWEAAAQPARDAGIRVVHPRSGLVVAGRGGAWGRLWPIFSVGAGGRLGTGSQYWSFISLRDEVAALTYLLTSLAGPVNLTAPVPATNREVTEAMGRLLRRPTALAVPAGALELVLGEFSSEVLGSIRALPGKLSESDFEFKDPAIDHAIRWAYSQR